MLGDGDAIAQIPMNVSYGRTTLESDVPAALLNDVPRNRLLAALPREEVEQLLPSLTHLDLPTGMIVYEPQTRITDVYFVLSGIVSMVSEMGEGTVEVGTVGCEGMTGLPIVLDADTMPSRAFVQVPGDAYKMDANDLRR